MIAKGIIAVDFDGTVVKHEYPEIGEELPRAIQTLNDLQNDGWLIIMWTCREGRDVDKMVIWLNQRGFYPNAANKNIDESLGFARHKILASYYFDDRSFPPFPGWDEVRKHFLCDTRVSAVTARQ